MTQRLAMLLPILLLSCASNPVYSDAEFLAKCWGAVATGGGEYQLSFEAILFPLPEGGTYARSKSCPDARINFASMAPEVEERFRQEDNRVARRPILGAGLRGRARIVPLERVNPFFLRVRVTRLQNLEQMSDSETEAFIRQHHIG
jgi:hypothetical protein